MFDGTLPPARATPAALLRIARIAGPLRHLRDGGAPHLTLDHYTGRYGSDLLTLTVTGPARTWTLRPALARQAARTAPHVVTFARATLPFCPVFTAHDALQEELAWLWDAPDLTPGHALFPWAHVPLLPGAAPGLPSAGQPLARTLRGLQQLTSELHALGRAVNRPVFPDPDDLLDECGPDLDYPAVLTLPGDDTVTHVHTLLTHANEQHPGGSLPVFAAPRTPSGHRALLHFRRLTRRALPLITEGLHLIARPADAQ